MVLCVCVGVRFGVMICVCVEFCGVEIFGGDWGDGWFEVFGRYVGVGYDDEIVRMD